MKPPAFLAITGPSTSAGEPSPEEDTGLNAEIVSTAGTPDSPDFADHWNMDSAPGPQLISGDRRLEQRYDLALPLRFSFAKGKSTVEGVGLTVDLSRAGILFSTDNPPPPGQTLELRIDWPYKLQGVCPLELVARGKIVQTNARGTLFQVRDYAFRTCGTRSFSQPATTGTTCNVVG